MRPSHDAGGYATREPGRQGGVVPALFHSTAPTRQLTWEERVLLIRTRNRLEGWEFHLWTDADLDLVMRQDHEEVYAKYRAITRGILRSDIGRYAVLHRCGGIYADTDYKFIRFPTELMTEACTLPVEAGVVPGETEGLVHEVFRLGNACLASVPGHPFWRDFIAHIFATQSLERLHAEDPIETTGPEALTRFWLARAGDYPDIALPRKVRFYPDLTWSRMGIARSRETVGIHMCWGSWRGRKSLHHLRTIARRKLTCLI